FQNGNAVYSSTTGVAAFMQTGTFDKWVASGGPTGATGFPVQDTVVIDGQGSYQVFARQTVYYGPYGKPLAFSPDAYRTAYEKSGGPTGPWGWPAGPGFPVGKGYAVPFQNGNAV
ncbi:LGFP repeat-containing protein, partial [Leucobacter sp. G161]|uniref:LGFP repeat-containing protein n=1 Tax=Leucobacter sp. G161 TaxID=663704 RepID=UPI000A4FF66B